MTNNLTVNRSRVIDKLQRNHGSSGNAVIYSLCEFSNRGEQTTVNLIANLLQQVTEQIQDKSLQADLILLYKVHSKFGTHPTKQQMKDLLQKYVAKASTVYIVVDALDECSEAEEDALDFVSVITSIGPTVKVLCTSRTSTTFGEYFSSGASIEISAQGEDIKKYLESNVQQQRMLSRHMRADPSLKEEIFKTIINECQGM